MVNFRKVLALVLVIATLFSFAAMAGAKFIDLKEDEIPESETSYYDDEADIDAAYLEGVRVLSYVKILNGYEDGTFKAQNNIRRNEMAKMIAVLANAGYDVEDLYATAANFSDVPADDWAASYVAYCAKTGIVAGRSATTFDPNASVTGLETAKMLLVVLGMDAEKQGYVGADWKVNVLRDAKVMGLLEGFKGSYSIDNAITREEAAHMMLNALKAPCVLGFLTDASAIEITNAWIFGDFDADDIDNPYNLAKVSSYTTLKDAVKDEDWAVYGDVIVSDDILCEVLFDIKAEQGVNCFGQPGTVWTSYQGRKETVLGVFHYVPDFESVDTDIDEVEEYLYDYWEADYNAILYIDGVEVENIDKEDDLQLIVDALDEDDVLGKGVQVEIYVTDETIFVVVINTYIGKIVAVNKPKNEVTIGDENGKTIVVDNDWGFKASDIDEIVLFWLCDEDRKTPTTQNVHDVEIIEPVTATVTRADIDGKGNHSFVADGETYEYAHTFGQWLNAIMMDDDHNFYTNGNKEHDIYLDKNGYVMYHEWTEQDNTEIVVIDGDSWKSSGRWENSDGHQYETNEADFIYFEEGAPVKTVETTWNFNKDLGVRDNSDILAWVEYADEDEIYFDAAADYSQSIASTSNATINLKKGAVKIQGTNNDVKDYLVNDDTQIIVRVPDYFGEDEEDSFTYMYFDGINDIDANYKAEEFQYFLDDQCGMKGEGRFYAYIYVDAKYAVESNRAFILRSAGATVIKLENGRVMGGDKYEAIVNGEEAIVVYEEKTANKVVDTQLNKRTDWDKDGVKDCVPVMVKSELRLIGWTLDDMPVWAQIKPDDETLTQAVEPDFMISGGVLSWDNMDGTTIEWKGIRMDPDCAIWIATPNKKGEFVAELVSQEDFNDEYRENLGWDLVKGYCWAVAAEDEKGYADSLYDYLLIVLVPEA